MQVVPPLLDPRALEAETEAFWASRGLPARSGIVGARAGRRTHQFLGLVSAGDPPLSVLQRAVLADVEARYLAMRGGSSFGTVSLRESPGTSSPEPFAQLMKRSGVWAGSGQLRPLDSPDERAAVQKLIERLAEAHILVARDLPLRSCPLCRVPRTPETIIYQEEEGAAYLVRFPLKGTPEPLSALVWTDSLWKLLGTTAVLLSPDLPYVAARYRRREVDERILVARNAVPRLGEWLPGSVVEVLEERPGAQWSDAAYSHPLSAEYPAVAALPAPAGTLVASSDVTDSGTALVTLVPAHGGTDSVVAQSLKLPGWPIVGADGVLERSLVHKYAGLPLDVAEAFILRDLTDGGFIFAQLKVRRGVPHCAFCGTALFWAPGRAWCVEPGRLSPEALGLFARLYPNEAAPRPAESVAWPASESTISEDGSVPTLAECTACDRLAPLDAGATCDCGGSRFGVRRRLLPAFHSSLVGWVRHAPFTSGDAIRWYVPQRRQVPAIIHQLVGLQAADAHPGDVRAVALPTLPGLESAPDVEKNEPYDALRATLVRTAAAPRGGTTFAGNRRQEARRLRKVWQLVHAITSRFVADGYTPDSGPIVSFLNSLLEEDRAFLSLFERRRIEVLRRYEVGDLTGALSLLSEFMEEELRDGYVKLVAPRLEAPGLSPSKVAAYRVLHHVLPLWAEMLAPIAPYSMERIHRAFRGDSESVFERGFSATQEIVLDESAEKAYARWRRVVAAVDRGRRLLSLAPRTPLPGVILVLRDEPVAAELRAGRTILARLVGAEKVDVASPSQPWDERRVQARPVLPEIQKAYPMQGPRIARMIEQLPGRRVFEGIQSGTLSVFLEGHPVSVYPAMVEISESLPPNVVSVPSDLGELYLRLPADAPLPSRGGPPPLSADAFRLVQSVHRRLARAANGASTVREVEVAGDPDVLAEIDAKSPAVSLYWGTPPPTLKHELGPGPDGEVVRGRGRRGGAWSVRLVGVTMAAPKVKHRPARSGLARARSPPLARGDAGGTLDYLDEGLREQESAVRQLVVEVDAAIGLPLLGPTKLTFAWEAGFRSLDDLRHAPAERLASVPGFGDALAGEVLRRLSSAPERVAIVVGADGEATIDPDDLPVPAVRAPSQSHATLPPGPIGAVGATSSIPLVPVPETVSAGQPLERADAVPGPAEPVNPSPPPGSIATEPPSSSPEPAVSTELTPSGPGGESLSRDAPEAELSPPANESEAGLPVANDQPPESMEPALTDTQALEPTPESTPVPSQSDPTPPTERAPDSETVAESTTSPAAPGERVTNSVAEAGTSAEPVEPSVPTEPTEGAAPSSEAGVAGGPNPEGRLVVDRVLADPEVSEAPIPPVAEEPEPASPDPVGAAPTSDTFPSEPPGNVQEETASEGSVEPPEEPIIHSVTGDPPSEEANTPPPAVSADSGAPLAAEGAALESVLPSEVGPSVASGEPRVVPPSEPDSPPVSEPAAPVGPPPPASGVLLWSAPTSEGAWNRFLEATGAGHRGLCLSREFPQRLRAFLGDRNVSVVWLSNVGRENAVRPGDLPGLQALFHRALETDGVTAIFIEGMEYLATVHSLPRALELLKGLDAEAKAHAARVWVPINPALINAASVERLAAEFPPAPESA